MYQFVPYVHSLALGLILTAGVGLSLQRVTFRRVLSHPFALQCQLRHTRVSDDALMCVGLTFRWMHAFRRFFKLIKQAHQQRANQLHRLQNLQQQSQQVKAHREAKYEAELERQRKYDERRNALQDSISMNAQAHQDELQVRTTLLTFQACIRPAAQEARRLESVSS